MSTSAMEARIPEITLGWRLKIALGDESAQSMADYLGVSRQTLSRWMGDKGAAPSRAYILQWAMRTGTDAEWLETGKAPSQPEPEGGLRYAITDSNREPADLGDFRLSLARAA